MFFGGKFFVAKEKKISRSFKSTQCRQTSFNFTTDAAQPKEKQEEKVKLISDCKQINSTLTFNGLQVFCIVKESLKLENLFSCLKCLPKN